MNVIITGANRGLGLGLSKIYLERGDRVTACARSLGSAPELTALHKQHKAQARLVELDVASDDSVAALARHVGDEPIDVLINNAGMYDSADTLDELDFGATLASFNVNSLGALRVAHALTQKLRRPGAKVVNISSKMGSIGDNAQGGAYAYRMSKAALNMGSKTLAIAWRPVGVVVAVLHPGWVQTRMGGEAAPLSVEQSTQGMVRTIDKLSLPQSGGFFNYDGAPIAW